MSKAASRRALGARVGAYVCTEARPPRIVRIRAPLRERKPSTRLTVRCPCGEPEAVTLFDWHLPIDGDDLDRVELRWPDDVIESETPTQGDRRSAAERADEIIAALRERGGSAHRDEIAAALGVSRGPIGVALQREAERDRPRFTSDRGVIRLAGSRRMSPRERDAERIAAALRRDGPLTRGELSKRLAISASLVSRAAAWEADQDAPRFASDRNPRTARYALTDG